MSKAPVAQAALAANPAAQRLSRFLSREGGVRVRMAALAGVLAVGFGLVVSAAWSLMLTDGPEWRELAEKQRQRRLHIVPKRGSVYDRNGSALAVTVEVPSVSLDGYELLRHCEAGEVPAVARDAAARIAAALSLDAAVVERKILRKKRFTWLKRQITEAEAERIRELSTKPADGGRRVGGLRVEGEGQRFYPRRQLASTVLGFVGPDGVGKEGLEMSLDGTLRGQSDKLSGYRDRRGQLLFADGIEDDKALAGHDVTLTLDQGVQYVAERELSLALRTFEAVGGSVVVIDPHTGELLALASAPRYNANDFRVSVEQPELRRERAGSDVFEPGSTMKMFTLAAGIGGGAIEPTQKLFCENGFMPVDNVTIRDTHPSGWLTISQVLSLSSNICSAKIGLMLGERRLYESLRRFGFGQASGIGLPGETSGTLRPRGAPWVQVETASAAFGQGIGVTAIQLAVAASAIANDGELMEPILVKRVVSATGEVVSEAAPRVRRRVIKAQVARIVREMLVGVTEGDGTGVEAAIDGYRVAGKTATAQKTDPKTGRYSEDKFIASFVGMVPAEHPVAAIVVVVDEPMVEHAGGVVAAPVFRRVAEMVLRYRGLVPRGTKPADLAALAKQPDPARATMETLRRLRGDKPPVQESTTAHAGRGEISVPDFTGLPVRTAVRKAVELGVVPEVVGTGLLARQTPAPGGVLAKGGAIKLVFEPAG